MTEPQLPYDLERFGPGWRIVDDAGATVQRFPMSETAAACAELDRLNAPPAYATSKPAADTG